MDFSKQIAQHLRAVYNGGNWTSSSLKDHLFDLNWKQAITKHSSNNSIYSLVYHMTYYIPEVLKVLKGGDLVAKDKFSWEAPPISSKKEWDNFLEKVWQDAEECAKIIEQLPDEKLFEDFSEKKYGTYFRNLVGMIEHLHYHLGQIVILKKILSEQYKS